MTARPASSPAESPRLRSRRDAAAPFTQATGGHALATLLTATGALAQAPSPPCRTPEFAQFDFWLGDWTVRWTDQDKGELAGSNRIRKTLDGCVILEEFDGRPGSPLTGTSVSTFVPGAGR